MKILELNEKQFALTFNIGVLRRIQNKQNLNLNDIFREIGNQNIDTIYLLFKEMLLDKNQYSEEFLDSLTFTEFSKMITLITELIVDSMPKSTSKDKKKK